ncbi:hypothetical protein [Sphingomonas sp. HMP6]|uniref:hypothetical protein n=1 Tax=Sphingomonas sp. HMP6 TaxID=1517551 RepID=UPI0015966F10|nr:hypothetical protein [Sphingomonas sp. HMP6]BCA59474.1 hypothetical protein HMP06_2243 [Sphingomonas sp. HMP6]
MQQARSDARKQAKIKRHEKAVQLQMALEDRAAARALQQELAELHHGSIRWAAQFKVQVKPDKPETRTSPVTKRIIGTTMKAVRMPGAPRPDSSWAVDALGMKGVIWQQSYLGRKSPNFKRGAARENWEYIVRDEAVLLDEAGEPVIISNMGDDWVEIGAAWQALEDASTRANAKIQMLAIAPFDSDMSEAEMIAALTHFCKTVLEPLDLPYSAAIHRPPAQGDARNFHPHIAFSLRPMRWIEPYCWEVADEVCGELDGRDGVQMLRHLWAHSMSAAAEQAQSDRRYTGLGYGARKLDLETGEHLGEGNSAIVVRGGHVWAHERNRIRAARNAARRAIRDADDKIAAVTKIRDAAVKRLEWRIDVTPAKIVRGASTVESAAILSRVRAPVPARVWTESLPTAPVKVQTSATPVLAVRPAITATTPSVKAAAIAPSTVPAPATIRSTSAAPVLGARRWSVSPVPDPAHYLRASQPVNPGSVLELVGRARPVASPFAPGAIVAPRRALAAARPVRPPITLIAASANITGRNEPAIFTMFDALALARSRRLRKRRMGMDTEGLRLA